MEARELKSEATKTCTLVVRIRLTTEGERIVDEETRLVAPPGASSPSDAETPSLPATNAAEKLAANVLTALALIADRMELQSPHPETARRVRGARTVSREFVIALIAAVEARPELQALETFDINEAREVLQSNDSVRTVADRLAMLLSSVNYTMEARWAKIAHAALDTYRLASAMAFDPANGALAAHVEILRRHLGRTSRTKKKPRRTGGETGEGGRGE
jgi:hypothetical protein